MELIERYIYAVTHRLPQSQREDIAKELRGLIEDMLEERGHEGQVTEKQVEEVLLELGDPRKLADKYRGTKRYLIGPELFDHYLMVLKIALIATGVVIGATFVIQVMLDPSSILESFISLIVSTVNGIPMAFGWTTFGFAVIQFVGAKQLNVNLQEKKSWNPSDLPVVPDPKGRVKRGDAIAGIVFYTIFIAIFGVSNEYFGVWFFEDGKFHNVIPFFNEDLYGYYFLFIVLMFGFGIIKECLKLIYGRWTMKLVIFTLIVNVISGIGLLFVIAEPAIWNPNFMSQLVESGLVVAQSETYNVISFIWGKVTYWLFILWLFALVWDVIDGYIRVRRSKRSE
ncbi:HAAS signaling domain-containing protein [Robertmurraya kyonggiensis]|uniref:Uncharacterized protein n=1 Tax=Robertmurraya kyonggiensis TaxID=1037680 RepID=A0A4U1D363_9BACI|nr:hypothetical protein [Robertmurraya kyonggiensis]TKC16751.1 hypothetical protein FA727_11820 [Robertmurraya kyonggiensis]